jgi:hypothetical protein
VRKHLRRGRFRRKSVIRTLSDEGMNADRAPFWTREARPPTLVWPRELPIAGEPEDLTRIEARREHGWRRAPFRCSSSPPNQVH